MEEIVQDTGIFRRITRRMKTPDDVKAFVEEWHDDHDVEKRLGDVSKTLRAIVAAYRDTNAKTSQVIKGKRYKFGHRYGDLPSDAPPEAFDARDALKLLDDIRAFIDQKMIDRAVIAAYELGFTCCQVGVRRHEATIRGRAKGAPKTIENADDRHNEVRRVFQHIQSEGLLTGQSEIINKMLSAKWLIKPSATSSDGIPMPPMPSRSTIEKVTKGMAKTAPKQNRKRDARR